MTTRIVTTQTQLDAALIEGADYIEIRSERGVWLTVEASDSATVEASDSATVRASGSATVRASDSATVEAYGSATVRASGSATVRAYGSATVRAYGSATVEAYDSATVEAYGSATVEAYGSATVEASDSATVRASGSATVRASDSATVRASGSATVRASGSATVEASSHVAVHLHSGHVTLDGGVVIDHTAVDLRDPITWCSYSGVTVLDGIATVYKAVNDNYTTDRGFDYTPGTLTTCPDWRDDTECGGGLHFSPTPSQARDYYQSATRFVEVGIAVEDLRPILGGTAKCKAPLTVRAAVEVDVHGRPVPAPIKAAD